MLIMSKKEKSGSVSMTKKRKWLTLEQKLHIIKLYEEGATYAKIGREKGMDESSVRKLIKKKEIYKMHSTAAASYLSKTITKNRGSRMVNMERLLSMWIEDLNEKGIPPSQTEIQAKALSIYKELKENVSEESSTKFTASRGWFFRFKKRMGIHNVGTINEVVSGDNKINSKSPQEFNEIMEKDNYNNEQIFNVDETGFLEVVLEEIADTHNSIIVTNDSHTSSIKSQKTL